jgi:predicted NAD-dependent protein-ADP-ribosyltransferase YbiA (DUF1768 family)
MMGPDEHLAAVLAAEADGQDGDFLFFWGHQPRPDGTIGPSCLSQWWPASFSVDGIAYPTAEHWMMAAPRTSTAGTGRAGQPAALVETGAVRRVFSQAGRWPGYRVASPAGAVRP